MSETTTIRVSKPGVQSLIVDRGRQGHRGQGVPLGGALDRIAARHANHLLGNPIDTPLIEMTLIGPTFQFLGAPCTAVLTGAHMRPVLNGKQVENDSPFEVSPDSVLKMSNCTVGCRAYLAVAGKWDVPTFLGSASPLTPSLTPWAYLNKDTTIVIQPSVASVDHTIDQSPSRHQIEKLRLLPGPESNRFNTEQLHNLFQQFFRVSPDSSRMGLRLAPAQNGLPHEESIISSGIIPGTVQLTPDGSLILLLADAQTTGGYPRIGVLQSDQLDSLAQVKPGDQIEFQYDDLG